MLAAVTDDVSWRGLTGSCPGNAPELEYTDDGGVTWNSVDPEVRAGFSALVRVVPESASEANVVTLDAECAPQLIGTFVAGDAWEDHSSNLGSYWYLDPMDRATVHAPDGSVPAPCGSAVSIATRSTSEAAVLCEDQAIFSTTDGGANWDTATVPGATAVAGAPDGYVVAVVGQGQCTGTSVVTLLGSRVGLPAGCGGEAPAPGETAISMAEGGTLWLWAGAFFARSTDGGLTWS
ncbi:hypothetical protein C3E77_02850 [Mycetocola zhujimingii]|nr:hypothetical protein C3E77_02850 [Mycetocola zhujimingii]